MTRPALLTAAARPPDLAPRPGPAGLSRATGRRTLGRALAAAAALCLALAASVAQAARPMITDDARLTDPKACQVESWVRQNRDSTEFWALPACNPTGNLELTLGAALVHQDGETRTTDVIAQAKTLFRPLEPGSWGWGLVAGYASKPAIDSSRSLLGDAYAYVPASVSLAGDRVVAHVNLGWLHDRQAGRDYALWGLGTEVSIAPRTWFIGEAFGRSVGGASFQLGLRHWLLPGRLQLDATVGDRFDHGPATRWFSIGLRAISPAFIP